MSSITSHANKQSLTNKTSGMMIVARNSTAASILCQQWRERDLVKKTYLAYVKHWPPYHEQKLLEGEINLPLAASRTERIKWEVRSVEDGGKASLTVWKVHKSSIDASKMCTDGNETGLTLELQPLTGRTHQLRIHCAEVGSGIEGDSLYGDSPIEWKGDKIPRLKTLRLHAHKLTFQHPESGKVVTFESAKPW